LPLAEFPSLQTYDPRMRSEKVIVFMVGGATYEESKEMATTYNTGGEAKVIVGGTNVINSKSFMAEIS